jgi:hypothetical protein
MKRILLKFSWNSFAKHDWQGFFLEIPFVPLPLREFFPKIPWSLSPE